MQLNGNTVLITGGTSGIGLAFAEKFAQEGSKVIITDRREDRLKKIQESYPEIIVRASDVADERQREALAQWIIGNYPDINILINNAGVQLLTSLERPVDLARVRHKRS
jgi:uncharacterized oxidoreductase